VKFKCENCKKLVLTDTRSGSNWFWPTFEYTKIHNINYARICKKCFHADCFNYFNCESLIPYIQSKRKEIIEKVLMNGT
jgi:hypothetical protein